MLKSLTIWAWVRLTGIVVTCCLASIQAGETVAQGTPIIIDDNKLIRGLANELGELTLEYEGISSKALEPQFERKEVSMKLPQKKQGVLDDLYSSSLNGVSILTSVYKCDKCPHWHLNGFATCWTLSKDGVMVTNHHFFKDKDVAGYGIMARDGHISPVIEILATDEEADIVIFRVAKREKGYEVLALGNAQKVGGNAHIIAHPDRRFYTYTSGKVSRYFAHRGKRKCYYMGVTAEYAHGSSGGPVLNDEGNVIGMVASTNSIYHQSSDPKRKPQNTFQMVIRNCVPVDAIRKLIVDSNKENL